MLDAVTLALTAHHTPLHSTPTHQLNPGWLDIHIHIHFHHPREISQTTTNHARLHHQNPAFARRTFLCSLLLLLHHLIPNPVETFSSSNSSSSSSTSTSSRLGVNRASKGSWASPLRMCLTPTTVPRLLTHRHKRPRGITRETESFDQDR